MSGSARRSAAFMEMAPVIVLGAAVLVAVALLFDHIRGIHSAVRGLRLPGLANGVKKLNTNLDNLGVQAQLAQTIAAQQSARKHPVLATSVACKRTSSNPKLLGAPNDGHFDCEVTYTNGARRGWCVAFDAKAARLTAYYTSTQMCEGEPNAGRLG